MIVVKMYPSAVIITPVPTPVLGIGCLNTLVLSLSVVICTTACLSVLTTSIVEKPLPPAAPKPTSSDVASEVKSLGGKEGSPIVLDPMETQPRDKTAT